MTSRHPMLSPSVCCNTHAALLSQHNSFLSHLLVVPCLVGSIQAQHKLAELLLVGPEPLKVQAAAGVHTISLGVRQLCWQWPGEPGE